VGVQFDFHKDTRASMQKNAGLISSLAKERLHDEIVKVSKKNNLFGYVALLDELDLLKVLFPTLYRCKHNDQPIRYHPFDTYAHTMLTLWYLQQINNNYLVKLAMLYHDVGKPDQYAAYAAAQSPEERAAIHGSSLNHAIS
jgi:tRNA nucleotidyltransferase/poly(A) polymerase